MKMSNTTIFPLFTRTFHHSSYDAIAPNNPSLSAAGKVVFITGGGRGIGKGIATAFVEAGAKAIVIIGRSEVSLKETKAELSRTGKSAIEYFIADITDVSAVEAAFSATARTYGKVDILINNAGYLDDHVSIAESSLDDYWYCFEVNVKGPIIATQAFLKVAAPNATVINLVSGAAHVPYAPGYSGYGTAKMASAKLMEYLQHEEPGLRVFNMQPGTIPTDMAKKVGDFYQMEDQIDLPASFCVWLASGESDFLKGRLVWANWDVNEMKARSEEIVGKDLLTMRLTGWPAQPA